ncbi:MAG: alpha-ketoacid dehydrogenase subunit beta [Candidatus Omnitrophota bacterium]|nr:MAG: alpha-ketoacid dehydrogenase subunit beta [Candidatus Omnitrophota bacterium]
MAKISFDWDSKSIEREESGFEHAVEQKKRKISYAAALYETFDELLRLDERIFIMGQGADDPFGMFGATLNLHKKHGAKRVFDTPLSEEGLTGIAIGAALAGRRPIYMHNRPDFLLCAMNQLVNHASKWSYMFGGKTNVPLVIWAAIGRGWGSGAQHSQSLQGLFMHIPGLKLVMPSTPYDAKGLLVSSVLDENPVIILEHRWLLKHTGYAPDNLYSIPFGKGVIRKSGRDLTIVGASYMIIEAQRAAEELEKKGVSVEVIDLRSLKPLDEELILSSVKKTGRLLIVDTGWKTGGVSAEIAAVVAEKGLNYLKEPIKRLSSPDVPTPAGYVLEKKFYPEANEIIKAATELAGEKS